MSCWSETGASSRPSSAARTAFGLVEPPVDGDGCESADALAADHGPIGDERLDGGARSGDGRRRPAQLVGVAVDEDAALVDER